MKKLLLLLTMTVACLRSPARAAISVGSSGSAVYTFTATPPATEFATHVMIGTGGLYTDATVANYNTDINTNNASIITRVLETSGTTPPSSSSLGFRRNTANNYLQSRPTSGTPATNAANVLMATLQNDSPGNISSFTVSYNFGIESLRAADELRGLFVFYSLSGAPGSWQPISALSQNLTVGAQSATVTPGTWAPGTPLYLLWADDNSNTGDTDETYTIDNFVIIVGGGMIVTLSAPTNSVLVSPATVNVAASVAGGTVPATSVSFYTNDVLFVTDTTAPYSDQLVNLPAGTYTVYARAANGVDPDAFSGTNIVIVRGEFIDYAQGTYVQDFDIMGATGPVTPTPQGWWIGAAMAGSDQYVTVDNGSLAPSGSIHGLNYGSTGNGERALGTSPTGNDRHTVARVRNVGSSNIVSFNVAFDAEVWRTHAVATQETLVVFVSYDLGANWVPAGASFDFLMPAAVLTAPLGSAIDGNDSNFRQSGLGGSITPPSPIPPGTVLYIRWANTNDNQGADGGIAIDNFSFTATDFSQSTLFVNITSPTNGQTIVAGCAASASITVNASAAFSVTNVRFSLDGGSFIDDASAPYSANYPTVGLGGHTLTALAFDGSGSTVSTSITVTVVANASPSINYSNVYSGGVTGLTFQIGTPVTNQFGITDDGTLTLVEFLVNGNVHYATNVNFGQIVVNNLLAGNNTFTVRATDNCGNVSTASQIVVGTLPAGFTVIVTNGAVWNYNNAGAQPPNDGLGNIWYQSAFDDSLWSSGLTEIGGGDAVAPPNANPERTTINIGPANARFTAIYFRKTFTVADPSAFGGLSVRSLRDDGAAVYLNGALVATFNTTNETGVPFAYENLADNDAGDDGTVYFSSNIVNSLVAGVNTLAVEVHQSSATSSDLSFDLMLWGQAPVGPSLTIRQVGPGQVEVSWPTSADPANLYFKNDLNDANWQLDSSPRTSSGGFYHVLVNTATMRFWTLRL